MSEPLRLQVSEIERIELHDVPNHFIGGVNLVLNADGSGLVQQVLRGGSTNERHVQFEADTLPYIVATMNEVDFLSVPEPTRYGVPDEARPAIHIHLTSGRTLIRWKWANDTILPFDSVYKRLIELTR
jgi:hypothetical protein